MKKIIDEKGRLFGKISIIDLVVLVVVAILVVAVMIKFTALEKSSVGASDTITYQVRIENIREYTTKGVRIGDIIYENVGGTNIGVVTNIEVSQAMATQVLADGSFARVPVENRYDVVLTVECEGLVSNGRYYLNKTYEISSGLSRAMFTKYCTFSATFAGIE